MVGSIGCCPRAFAAAGVSLELLLVGAALEAAVDAGARFWSIPWSCTCTPACAHTQ